MSLLLGLGLAAGGMSFAKPGKAGGSEAGAAAKIACAGAGSVTVAATDVKLKCDAGHKNCDGEIPVRAKNCSQDFLEVVQLEMYRVRSTQLQHRLQAGLCCASGAGLAREGPVDDLRRCRGRRLLSSHRPARDQPGDGARANFRSATLPSMPPSALARSATALGAFFGAGKAPSCNCKTRDAGKTCHDGNDCQGSACSRTTTLRDTSTASAATATSSAAASEIVDKGASAPGEEAATAQARHLS